MTENVLDASWITTDAAADAPCPVFEKVINITKPIVEARLEMTALGVYHATINGCAIADNVLAPGWTSYQHRLQYQSYDVTKLLEQRENVLAVIVGPGWYRSPLAGWVDTPEKHARTLRPLGLIASLTIEYRDGTIRRVTTSPDWRVGESRVRFSQIYDGETYDADFEPSVEQHAALLMGETPTLVPQAGPLTEETTRIMPRRIFKDTGGATIVDFGQELTGYVELRLTAHSGERVVFTHGEMLDKDGNFYNDNYRSAKAIVDYRCNEGAQKWHPQLTFFGFRYLKLIEFPGEPDKAQFTAVSVHSHLERTGEVITADSGLNALVSNVFWSQKDNFLDIPSDCPQRDERLGWTGDVVAFIKAASYNYNVLPFFKKWLTDVRSEQRPNGVINDVCPDVLNDDHYSAAWGDVITIAPWQLYQTYGDSRVLIENFDAMTQWVDHIATVSDDVGLWTGGDHFGDWLGLDAPEGSYKGSSRDDFVASAFYARSTAIVVAAGHVIGRDVSAYEQLYARILAAFNQHFPTYHTQTECALAIEFGLTEAPQQAADQLAQLVKDAGVQMRTGFVGTPHLLRALSQYGHSDLAYQLLLRRDYPSWLYSVEHGATTTWEHWDGIKVNGDMWSTDMNSFNHYAYGAVIDWMYEEMAGITPTNPGFATVKIEPRVSDVLPWAQASIQTVHGLISSQWRKVDDAIRYDVITPVETEIIIGHQTHTVSAGSYVFWS